MRTAARAMLSTVLALAPAVAVACPACARHESSALAISAVVGMILAPFGLAAVVYAVVRRGEPSGEDGR